jgi:hypothetical protein
MITIEFEINQDFRISAVVEMPTDTVLTVNNNNIINCNFEGKLSLYEIMQNLKEQIVKRINPGIAIHNIEFFGRVK